MARRMLGEIDFSKIDVARDIMSVYMISYDDSDVKPSNYYLSMKDFNSKEMVINVNFTNPEMVSSSKTKDKFKFVLKNPEMFISQRTGKTLNQSSNLQTNAEIPR
jgi:hypothetical protein